MQPSLTRNKWDAGSSALATISPSLSFRRVAAAKITLVSFFSRPVKKRTEAGAIIKLDLTWPGGWARLAFWIYPRRLFAPLGLTVIRLIILLSFPIAS